MNSPSTTPVYLRPEEVAASRKITTKTLSNWRSRGVGPTYIKFGGSVLYREEDLLAWEAANTVEAVSA